MSSPYESWGEEKRSAWIYSRLSEIEKGTPREAMFRKLGEVADGQARIWAKRIEGSGAPKPSGEYVPEPRVRAILFLVEKLGPKRMRSALAGLKVRGLSAYSASPVFAGGHAIPSSISEVGQRHQIKGAGGNIRAAVFGVSDGLVSNASLILGVGAAASFDTRFILMSGTAGLLAGALSMASGEFVSVKSQRELLEYQLDLERAELEEYPQEEAAELALIYAARGIPEDQARDIANKLISDPDRALSTLAREELGLDPDDLGSPVGAALSSFLAFALGGLVPLLPFLFYRDASMIWVSIGVTAAGLFLTGALVSIFSGRSLLWSGLRMLLIGGGAGLITYLIGKGIG